MMAMKRANVPRMTPTQSMRLLQLARGAESSSRCAESDSRLGFAGLGFATTGGATRSATTAPRARVAPRENRADAFGRYERAAAGEAVERPEEREPVLLAAPHPQLAERREEEARRADEPRPERERLRDHVQELIP